MQQRNQSTLNEIYPMMPQPKNDPANFMVQGNIVALCAHCAYSVNPTKNHATSLLNMAKQLEKGV